MTEPYLSREHAPVDRERDDVDLRVEGELPRDLSGLFLRNSPNPRFAPPGRYHWFDGDGMIHALGFADGRASYRNRWVRTPGFLAEEEAGKALWGGILDPVDLSNPRGPVKDTANTHLVVHRGQLIASWWLSGAPQALDLPSLDTVGPPAWTRALGRKSVAAHPKVDPRTGELVFFGYSLLKPPFYWVGLVSADGQLVRCEDVDVAGARIPHDIGLTDRYVVILDLPLGWDAAAIAKGKRRIGFDREAPSRIGLWPRSGGPVRWFDVPACYVYHLTSSYEEGDDAVVLTGCRIDDPIPDRPDDTGTIARLDSIHLAPVATRWRLDLRTGRAAVETLDDVFTEFPRVNDTMWGRPTRYAYHPRLARHGTLAFDGFLRLDHTLGTTIACDYPKGWWSGEVVFAPRPGAIAEDDGWVITVLTNPDEPASVAWVIDAKDVGSGPIAKVHLPWRVPLGFHAEWAPR